jgi:CheY-like chemotaxis protein
MTPDHRPLTLLIAEDDPDDRLLLRDAFQQCPVPIELRFAFDGEELLDRLRGPDPTRSSGERPCLILLDLNMPRVDGVGALRAIKGDERLRMIPVVVLTTSSDPDHIVEAYDLGANSYIVKPQSFAALLDAMQSLADYWFQKVRLPELPSAA